jgi:heme-degrading monooxygenase HmoA
MPVVVVSQAESREVYEAVSNRLRLAHDRPAGLLAHGAGESSSGEVRIATFWESAEHARAFERERLFPAFEATGTMPDGAPEHGPELVETFEYVGYSGTTAVT